MTSDSRYDNLEELPDRVRETLKHEYSETTRAGYERVFRYWSEWAESHGYETIPADPERIVQFLQERAGKGNSPSYLQHFLRAISYYHTQRGLSNPGDNDDVRSVLSHITRESGSFHKQAAALTMEDVAAIKATACLPRQYPSGWMEPPERARRRGLVDIALISLMRDGLLRRREAVGLKWSDLTVMPDGSGRLLIRRSKTDREGRGKVVYVPRATVKALAAIRDENAKPSDSMFGLRSGEGIRLRIRDAAKYAGLGDGYTGHSPRVGMTRDLARFGIQLPALMAAGRWKSAIMPAYYIRNEEAGRGIVADYTNSL